MSLSILNNISALTAQNQLSTTQSNLQKTLTQLASGLRINSGADDAAGLSIANGLSANIAALTQSQQNASNGIGLLQTADGALSQVTALLNRAVTLATEASNSTLNGQGGTQATALNQEFTNILSTITTIGQKTNFNGSAVFGASLSVAMSDGTAGGDMTVAKSVTALTTTSIGLNTTTGSARLVGTGAAADGDTISIGGTQYTFTTSAITSGSAANTVFAGNNLEESLSNLAAAINGGSGSGTLYASSTAVNSNVTATDVSGTGITLHSRTGTQQAISTSSGAVIVAADGATQTSAGTALDLLSNTNASAALTALTSAIGKVAAQRGAIGATINQLQASSNVMNTEVQNLSSAQNSVLNADIGQTVANMTQYNILQSTGMSALQQANQSQQSVLKLLQ